MRIYNEEKLERISNLRDLSRLRIPQSIWIPIASGQVEEIDDVKSVLSKIEWNKLPSLSSHGPRVSINRGSVITDSSHVLSTFFDVLPDHLSATEFSLRIDSGNQLSLQMNAIPPRAWVRTPAEISGELEPLPEWSTRTREIPTPIRPTEDSIRLFRNESSLACLCAGLVRLSSFPAQLVDQPECLVWDPFVGNGAVLMEVLQYIVDKQRKLEGEKTVTIVGNLSSKSTLSIVKNKLDRFCERHKMVAREDDSLPVSAEPPVSRGRKNRQRPKPEEPLSGNPRIYSTFLSVGNTRVNIQLLVYPFEEVIPHISGACILTHMPKTYNEILGIEKRELSEWAAFGNWMRTSQKDCTMHAFSETESFFKYTKMKFSKLIHLNSPNGKSVGSMAQWLGL